MSKKKSSKGPRRSSSCLEGWLICVGHTAEVFKSQATQTSGPPQASAAEDCHKPKLSFWNNVDNINSGV
ncbi:hypothetical protein I79_005651 [Cricetulus griseus]|uniref:Uncharacterized protein n=1 Tax=Cricetulus griseus TaxID=10029 RepID=G3H5R4_CRIGR|nr:hypothetical protein I79_005651 [Cricetulus griseus]